jgi:four helix bundle protein
MAGQHRRFELSLTGWKNLDMSAVSGICSHTSCRSNSPREIFDLSKQFPEEEKYSLTSQIRRSSRSIGAQLAEAWAKRRYERHFVSKLTDADGEQMETQHWVGVASSCGYIDHETTTKLLNELQRIGQLVQEMIDSAESFCSASRAKEEPVDHES